LARLPGFNDSLLGCFGLFAGTALAACNHESDVSKTEAASYPVTPTLSAAAPARDGNIAIREEYEAALKSHTKPALELFIARHPEHPLSAEARKHLLACFDGADPAPAECQISNGQK